MKVYIFLILSSLIFASELISEPQKNKTKAKSNQQANPSKPLPPIPGDNPELQRWFQEQSELRDQRGEQDERRSRIIRQDWREAKKRDDERQNKRLEEQRRLERERNRREQELENWRKERQRREWLREEDLRRGNRK